MIFFVEFIFTNDSKKNCVFGATKNLSGRGGVLNVVCGAMVIVGQALARQLIGLGFDVVAAHVDVTKEEGIRKMVNAAL